ncbi:hypothetical protein BU24DRAFT_417142 [Aaosphaeria arxii CBS 175.79]|uniref:Uncharacterized protein n=1 Tax=Aaosphaeria arxii CBS 175.79 TaxID=1450172 RepID=A0A6A5Y9R5_9PLEO|nr:uncharacterized protein BU24DRAFT_417142 [Aaosphaeria arxii CBS 175.79]KAF2021501.1 hypothetical protein BU24DRAFT_417142 [Aaosphaeria arxii CBS 175.79]
MSKKGIPKNRKPTTGSTMYLRTFCRETRQYRHSSFFTSFAANRPCSRDKHELDYPTIGMKS